MLVDCDLVALLEDDTGMELLVCNKIISLELPVKDVHRKIWCVEHNEVLSFCPHSLLLLLLNKEKMAVRILEIGMNLQCE